MNSSRTGILFIHGIQEGPGIFVPYLDRVDSDWMVRRLLLRGHEASLREFGRASMRQWRQQVREALDEMEACCDSIYVVGHSMGTLLALEQVHDPGIAALFLADTPLCIHIRAAHLKMMALSMLGKDSRDPYYQAARKAWTTYPDGPVWDYVRIVPRYLELFWLILRSRRHLETIDKPVYCILSLKDEMVSARSESWLERIPGMKSLKLKDSGHFYKPSADQKELMAFFSCFLKEKGQSARRD